MAIMGFLAIAVAYTMRACLAVAITEMVIKRNQTNISNDTIICPVDLPSEGSSNSSNRVTSIAFQTYALVHCFFPSKNKASLFIH